MERVPVVYMLASERAGTLDTGLTSDLMTRLWQHRNGTVPGFTARYDVKRLVWFEVHASTEPAIRREKQLKKWDREWKPNLIEHDNPDWLDLAIGLVFEPVTVARMDPRLRGDDDKGRTE